MREFFGRYAPSRMTAKNRQRQEQRQGQRKGGLSEEGGCFGAATLLLCWMESGWLAAVAQGEVDEGFFFEVVGFGGAGGGAGRGGALDRE